MQISVKSLMSATFAVAMAVVGSSFLFAQDAPPASPDAKAPHAQTFRAKQILGAKVHLQGDAVGGTIDDIVLDDHGNVDYLIVAKDDATLVTVPWDAASFDADQRIATVQITQQRFNQVPTYTVKQYPVFTAPTYRAQVYKYYGVTPGQERRMIRRGAVVVPNP